MAFTHNGKNLEPAARIARSDLGRRHSTTNGNAANTKARLPPTPNGAIVAVACSPDGTAVATASEEGPVNVYRSVAPRPVFVVGRPPQFGRRWPIRPDGKMLVTGGYDDTVKIWNPATGELIRTFRGQRAGSFRWPFRPTARLWPAEVYDRSIRLWNSGRRP